MGQGSPTPQTLDERIASALVETLSSEELPPIIAEAKRAAAAAEKSAHQARERAFDPRLAAAELEHLRQEMEAAAFRRDRLEAAIPALTDRLNELRAAEEDERRLTVYERVKATRDSLAAELGQLYPEIEQRLSDLLRRLDVNNREIKQVNRALPGRRASLLEAELTAREIAGFRIRGETVPSLVEEVRLPRFGFDPMDRYCWPPERRPIIFSLRTT